MLPGREGVAETDMFDSFKSDLHAVLERDPAARNALEVVLCYPCLLYTSDAADE